MNNIGVGAESSGPGKVLHAGVWVLVLLWSRGSPGQHWVHQPLGPHPRPGPSVESRLLQPPCPLPLAQLDFRVSGIAQDEAEPCGFPGWVALSDWSSWCLTSSPTGFSLQDAGTCVLVTDTLPCA